MKIFRLFKKYPPRFPPTPPLPHFAAVFRQIRGQNLPVLHFAHYLPKPWTDGFAYVNGSQGW